jgi:hypothetical protein
MPITHDVTAARAERPLYASLYASLSALAEPHIQDHLREVTAANGARLLSEQVASLRAFLLEGEADGEDAAERGRLVAHLDRPLERDGVPDMPELAAEDACRELADQAAHSLAGAWLRHLRLTARDGRVEAGALLPPPGQAEPDADWSRIWQSVAPYGLGAPAVEAILRGLLRQWQHDTSTDIALPQRLTLRRDDVERALGGQALAPARGAVVGGPRTGGGMSILQTIREAIRSRS